MGSAESGQSGNETLYTRMVPILFMTDVAAERDFYVKLGFRVSYEGPEYPDFIALAYGSLEFGIEQSSQFGVEYPSIRTVCGRGSWVYAMWIRGRSG